MTVTQLGFDSVGRDQALARVLAHTNDEWRSQALQAIATLAATGRTFQAADLKPLGVPEPEHHSRWGGVFVIAANAGLIEHVGYEASKRLTVQGSTVKTWKGKDAQPVTPAVDRLRALSINRPYADQIMRSVKRVENRSKPTKYRGLLVVHASARQHHDALDDWGRTYGMGLTGFVGVVELVDVCAARKDGSGVQCSCHLVGGLEGFYHWQLANARPFNIAQPGKGRLGLFPVPAAVADLSLRIAAHPEAMS